jgi:hypothetical protein
MVVHQVGKGNLILETAEIDIPVKIKCCVLAMYYCISFSYNPHSHVCQFTSLTCTKPQRKHNVCM